MGFRDRVKRLERKAEGTRTELTCPQCGWQVTVHGDVWVDLVVLDWKAGPASLGDEPDEDFASGAHKSVVELFTHEHPYDEFVEKRSGKSLFDPTLSGMNLAGDAIPPRGEG
jgi:hypothetical protein